MKSKIDIRLDTRLLVEFEKKCKRLEVPRAEKLRALISDFVKNTHAE